MPQMTNVGAVPTAQQKSMVLERFRGVDLTSGVTNVDKSRSPDAPNILPDADGYPAKRPGWHTVLQLEGAVHGAFRLVLGEEETRIIHAGTRLYKITGGSETGLAAQAVYEDMADGPSAAVQLGGKLWLVDGKTYLCWDGETAKPVRDMATVPLVTIAKAPNGLDGATSYKPVNLLTGRRTDSFLGTEGDVDYYLSFQELTEAAVEVRQLDKDGVWQPVTGGFTVDRALGKVHFDTAPGKSPVTGEDNVRITYAVADQAALVDRERLCILYGVNGAMDRIFLTGDPQENGVDRWSEWNDPAYVGDTNYGVMGSEQSPIVGYSVLNDSLVAHKRGEENGRNAFVRRGSLDGEGNAVFAISAVVQGEGACAPHSFASVAGEPLFLTPEGVCALTAADITGERYAQGRSYYLDGALKREAALADAKAVVWGRFYVLALGGRLYLLDTAQKAYEKNAPQSSYQYEGYYWTNVDASALWTWNNELWFGTPGGAVRTFYTGGMGSHYMDDGEPITARWTTPLMNLGSWYQLKTVTGVWVVNQPYTRSGGVIYYATDREWAKLARDYNVDIFDWNDIDFQRWTFNTLDRPFIVNARKKAKKVKLFQVRVENARPREPFGIFAIHVNFRLGSKIKR